MQKKPSPDKRIAHETTKKFLKRQIDGAINTLLSSFGFHRIGDEEEEMMKFKFMDVFSSENHSVLNVFDSLNNSG